MLRNNIDVDFFKYLTGAHDIGSKSGKRTTRLVECKKLGEYSIELLIILLIKNYVHYRLWIKVPSCAPLRMTIGMILL